MKYFRILSVIIVSILITVPIYSKQCINFRGTWGTGEEGLGYNYCNGNYGIDKDHQYGDCAPNVCTVHSNVHSGK